MEKVETKRIKEVIIQNLQAGPVDYMRNEGNVEMENIYPTPSQELWLVWKRFSLESLREWAKFETENSDHKLFAVLDDLSAKREIKIFRVEIPKKNHLSLFFACEIGKSLMEVHKDSGWVPRQRFFYFNHPLSPTEFLEGDHTVVKPSVRIKELRARMHKAFEKQFGKVNFDIERELIRESILADAEIGGAILRIQKSIEKKAKESNIEV